MKILAIDAATEGCSVALSIDGNVTANFEVAPQQHSQILLPAVQQILTEADITISDLDAIAYGQGPGSFTGVRIGVAVTQGLAFGGDKPVIGISSLAAMAQQVIVENNAAYVLAAIDARMGEVYYGLYQNNNGFAELVGQEGVCAPLAVPLVQQADMYTAGTGWQTYHDELNERFDVSTSSVELPQAKYMLSLAEVGLKSGLGKRAELAQPHYVRDEVSWKKLPGR